MRNHKRRERQQKQKQRNDSHQRPPPLIQPVALMIPQSHPRIPPKRPRIDPKARLCFGFPTPEAPVLRFSDPRSTLSLDFCRLYRCCIDTVSILYRYSIDVACKNQKTGSQNRGTAASGVGKPKHRRALGSILGRFGGILG